MNQHHEDPAVPEVIGKEQRTETIIEHAAPPNVVETNGEDRLRVAAEGMTTDSASVEAVNHHEAEHAAATARHGAEHAATTTHRGAEALRHHGGAVQTAAHL